MLMQQPALKKTFTYTAIIVGIFGIVLQFILMLQTRQTSLAEAVVRFFSFFTILSNCMAVLYFLALLIPDKSKLYAFANKDEVATAVSIYMIVVGVVYQTILRQPIPLQDWPRIADDILHLYIPLLMLVYWIVFFSAKKIDVKTIPYWLIYPAVYLAYTLIRGSIVHFYPYPFVNVNKLGYQKVLINSALLVLFFLILCVVFAAIANWRYKNKITVMG
jgi:hypothetical protein